MTGMQALLNDRVNPPLTKRQIEWLYQQHVYEQVREHKKDFWSYFQD